MHVFPLTYLRTVFQRVCLLNEKHIPMILRSFDNLWSCSSAMFEILVVALVGLWTAGAVNVSSTWLRGVLIHIIRTISCPFPTKPWLVHLILQQISLVGIHYAVLHLFINIPWTNSVLVKWWIRWPRVLIKLVVYHILYVIRFGIYGVLVVGEVFMTAFEHVANMNVLVLSIISIVPIHFLMLIIINCILITVLILLSSVESNSVSTYRNISSLMGSSFNDGAIVKVTVLIVLD